MSLAFDPGDPEMPLLDDERPATKADIARTEHVLRTEMQAMLAHLRADIIDTLNARTTALLFSQVGSIVAVAAIAFAD